MNVRELSQNQLDFLKWDYYCSDNFDPATTNSAGLPVLFHLDIPNEVIFDLYEGISFVPEDFGT